MDHLLRQLLLVQAAVVATATVEAAIFGAASPNLVPLALLNLAGLVWTLRLRRGIGRGERFRTRALRWTQRGWIGLAILDLGLALALADRGLEPVALLTRVVLPVAILRVARRLDEPPTTVTVLATEVAA